MRFVLAVSLALFAAAPGGGCGLLPGELGQLQGPRLHQPGILYTTDNNYLANSSRGSFEFNRARV